MRKLFFLIISVFFLIIFFSKDTAPVKREEKTQKNTVVSPTIIIREEKSSIFVPYWAIPKTPENLQKYDTVIYFGIAPKGETINTQDAGYLRLKQFTKIAEGKSKLLAVRMLDSKTNFTILENKKNQNIFITETIKIAKEYGFDGIVLNLELSALPFESVIQNINKFIESFSFSVKKEDLTFSMTIYGDTYYRVRPFEISTLSKYVDQLYLMAYDLHKAGGNPGPNFPLSGQETYGYDMELLINRLTQDAPLEKIVFIFGLYGYDWEIDEKNISQKIGVSRSTSEIESMIYKDCKKLNCFLEKDEESKETTVSYKDANGKKHIIWFETLESVNQKIKYLKSKGLYQFSYWAYSYF